MANNQVMLHSNSESERLHHALQSGPVAPFLIVPLQIGLSPAYQHDSQTTPTILSQAVKSVLLVAACTVIDPTYLTNVLDCCQTQQSVHRE